MCLWYSTIQALCLSVWYYNIGYVSSVKYHKGCVSLVWYYVSYVSFGQVLLAWGTVHV